MIAVTFALPDESRALIRALGTCREGGRAAGQPVLRGKMRERDVLVFHTGLGAERTGERLRAFLDGWEVTGLISSGYAGGLRPGLPAGTLVLAENLSDPGWLATAGERLGETARVLRLQSVATVVETLEARATLARETGADAVDMESAAIARLCAERGIPLLSLRAISDPADEELAVPFSVCFDAETEKPKVGALLAFLARHPGRIPGFIRFVTRLGRVRAGLTQALLAVLEGLPPAKAAR